MAQPTEEPPVNFSTFLVSLASSALASLGHADGVGTAPVQRDLRLARHTLDLINLLAEKTKGNLDEEEAALLNTMQKELNEKYAAAAR